jgi:alpha-1,2-mannosyltransferase
MHGSDTPNRLRLRRRFLQIGCVLLLLGIANVAIFERGAVSDEALDFDLNWVAAHRLVDGEPIYDRTASKSEGLRLVGPEMALTNSEPFYSFIGPPTTALVYAPLTSLPSDTARDLWRAVSLLLMIASVIVVAQSLPRGNRLPAGLIGVGALLLSAPVARSIANGQVDGLVMLGLGVATWAAARQRWALAGIGLGVATVLKISPVLLVVYLVVRGRVRAGVSAAVTVVSALILAAVVGRPADLGTWLDDVAPVVGRASTNVENLSLPGWFARVFSRSDDMLSHVAVLPQWRAVGLAFALSCMTWLWWNRRGRAFDPLELGVLVLVAVLAGPLSWDHDASWAVIPVVLLADVSRWSGRPKREMALLLAILVTATLLMRISTRYVSIDEVAATGYLKLASGAKTIGLVLYLVVGIWMLRRPPPDVRSEDSYPEASDTMDEPVVV